MTTAATTTISFTEFLKFIERCKLGVFKGKRVGEAFCEAYNIFDDELHEVETTTEALEMIEENYVGEGLK